MRALNNNVVIQVEIKEKTESGLFLSGLTDTTSQVLVGRVITTGPEVTINISNGNVVHFKQFAANKITVQKTDYYVVSEKDILICEK